MKLYLRNELKPAYSSQKLPSGDILITGPCADDHSGDLPDMNSKEHLIYLGISQDRIELLESDGAFDEEYDSEPHADELYFIKAALMRLQNQDASAQLEACRFYLESSLVDSIQSLYDEHNVFDVPMAQLIMEILEGRQRTIEHLWRLVASAQESDGPSDRPSSPPIDENDSHASAIASISASETRTPTAVTSPNKLAARYQGTHLSSVFKGGYASALHGFMSSRVVRGVFSAHDAWAIASPGNQDLSCGFAPVVYTTPSREYAQCWSRALWEQTRPDLHLGAAVLEIEVTRELDSQIHKDLEPSDDWKRYCLSNRKGEFRLASRCALSAHTSLHTPCSRRAGNWSSLDNWEDVEPQTDRNGVFQTQVKIEMPHYEMLERCDAHLFWLTSADEGTFTEISAS